MLTEADHAHIAQVAEWSNQHREERNRLVPVTTGICCEYCTAWDEKNADDEGVAPCNIREEETNRASCCALYENPEGEDFRDITMDLKHDYIQYRKLQRRWI